MKTVAAKQKKTELEKFIIAGDGQRGSGSKIEGMLPLMDFDE